MSRLWIAVLLVACGGPIAQNAPRPNPAVVAGAVAAAAAAVTLAAPQGVAAQLEARAKGEPDLNGVEVKETVPGDVFDRLEHAPAVTEEARPTASVPGERRAPRAEASPVPLAPQGDWMPSTPMPTLPKPPSR